MTSIRKHLVGAVALAVGALFATGASAQFSERTIRVSNGINADHPVGNGVTKFNQCLAQKSGGLGPTTNEYISTDEDDEITDAEGPRDSQGQRRGEADNQVKGDSAGAHK